VNRGDSGQRAVADRAANEGTLRGEETQDALSASQWGFTRVSGESELILGGAEASRTLDAAPVWPYVLQIYHEPATLKNIPTQPSVAPAKKRI
jgi:hypothetical protein